MPIGVRNVMEVFVEQNLPHALDSIPGVCRCDQCMADIQAIILNNMKPKYVSTATGEVLSRLHALEPTTQVEFLCCVKKATDIVMAHPRHEKE